MTTSVNALWEGLSTKQKHEVAALAAAWQSRRARRIEAGMPASSPVVSDDDPTMETGSHDDSAPEPAPVHAGLTMEQAQAHFTVAMAEEVPTPAPVSTFRQAQEEQWYNLFLFEQHRLAEGQIYGERASEEVVAAMAATNPNFVTEQRALYEAACAQVAARNAEPALPDAEAIMDENPASYASYASPTNFRARRWHEESAGPSTSTGDGQVADSDEEE